MRALMYSKYGGPDDLVVREVPVPEPAAGEVLVKIEAAAINPIDCRLLRGSVRLMSGRRFPRHIGADFSGTVAALGEGVRGRAVGDHVFGAIGMLKGDRGSLAEFARAKATECTTKPGSVSFEQAAAASIGGMSALHCIDTLGNVREGQAVLVIGAAGSVGSCAVQVARARRLHVTGVCRGVNEEFVRQLGADDVIAYDRQDLFGVERRFDLIVDAAAAYSFGRCRALLAPAGTYVTTMPGLRIAFDGLRARLASRQRARSFVGRGSEARRAEVAELMAQGLLKPAVGQVFSLDDAPSAVSLLMTGHARGKLVVRPGSG
ncbi:MAG TPA: NAD(P)-dependent alcohol dehydrogenase [Vicinamibacterales bacterium]|nr:NAD(P)-dependent alcohol dehydrogenase [Vicinamibacterales bacterium]